MVKPEKEVKKRKDTMFSSEIKISEDNDRLGFIKKVYAICTCMILFTVFLTILPFVSDGLHRWMFENIWLHYVAIVGTLVIAIGILCCKGCSKSVPYNYIYLFGFTLCESYVVAGICGMYKEAPEVVLMAAVTSLAVFLGLTAFACCCKGMKLTICWGLGAALSMVFFPMILFFLIYPT